MSLQKKFSFSLLAISMSALPLFAQASIEIVNNTNQNTTAVVNNICSSNSSLGESGITRPHTSNTITDFVIWFACHATPSNCIADVYMTTNCGSTGAPKAATIVFDKDIGIKSIIMHTDKYSFTTMPNNPFSIVLNSGPAMLMGGEYEMVWGG